MKMTFLAKSMFRAATTALLALAPMLAPSASFAADPYQFEKKAFKPDGTPWTGPVNVGDTIKYVLSYKPGATSSGAVKIDDTLSPSQSYVAPTMATDPLWTWGSLPYSAGNHEQYNHPGFGPQSVKIKVGTLATINAINGDGTKPIPLGNRVFGVYHHSLHAATDNPGVDCWDLVTLHKCPGYPKASTTGAPIATPLNVDAVVRGSKIFWLGFRGTLPVTTSGVPTIGCFDTATDAACADTPLDPSLTITDFGNLGGLSEDPVSGRVFAQVKEKLFCRVWGAPTPGVWNNCGGGWLAGGNVAVTGPVPASTYYSNIVAVHVEQSAAPSHVYVHPGNNLVQCLEISSAATCSGWPSAGNTLGVGNTFSSIPNAGFAGEDGVCLWTHVGANAGCVSSAGATLGASIPTPQAGAVVSTFRIPGTGKIFFPRHFAGAPGPTCYDYAIHAPCGSPFTTPSPPPNGVQYGFALDPIDPGKCMLALGDGNVMWRFDYVNGKLDCGKINSTSVVVPDALLCSSGKPAPKTFTWTSFKIITPGALGSVSVSQGSSPVTAIPLTSGAGPYTIPAGISAGPSGLDFAFAPSGSSPTQVEIEVFYIATWNQEICYQTKVNKCGPVFNDAVMSGMLNGAPFSAAQKVDLGMATGPGCTPPPVDVPSCLSSDAKIKCGAVPGTYVVTITPNGVGGVLPDYVEVSSLTPGVVVTPANASIPVLGGKATVTLSGTAGTVAELQVNGTKINLGSADGTDICCNGKIKVTLPDCPKPIPVDLKVVKTGGTTPAPDVPAYAFSLNITNEGAAYTAAPGVLSVTDVVPAGMIFNSVTGSAGWTCLPNTNVAAGTLITCTYAGGALPAGPATPVGVISIVATALGQMPFPDFTNCADVALSGADGAVDTKPENNHSCVTVSKKPKDKVDVAIVKTGEVIDQAVVSYAFKLDITNIASGFAGAGNVVVTDVVPSGMTFNTINGAPDWSCVPSVNAPSGSTVSCTYTGAGPVAPGASMWSIKITAKGVGQSQGTFTNCADVAFIPASNLSDANPADNHSCATVSHGPKTNDIKLTKSGGGMGGSQGPNYAFNLDVVNVGAPFNGAGAVQVTDIVPAGMTFLATTGPGWSCNAPVSAGGTLLCTYSGTGIVPTGGALQQIGITAIGPANTSFQNCADATFTASSNLFDGNSVNNRSCVQVNAQKPVISVPAVIGGGIIGGVIVDQVINGGPKCDPATTLKRGKECVCRFSTMVKNSATTCACPDGATRVPGRGCVAVPPVCQPPLHLDASGRCVKSETICAPPMVSGVVPGQCFCPAGMIKEGDTCVRKRNVCQPPMIPAPNDAGCVCPRGTRLERGDCVKDTPVCRAPMVQGARPGQCVCPQGTRQAGGTCIAPPRCRPPMQPNAQGNGCACPAGTVQRGGTCVKPNTCVAPARDNGRGQCICPQNMKMQNGHCAPVKPRVVPDGVLQHLPGLLLNLPFGGRGGGHGSTGGPRGPVP